MIEFLRSLFRQEEPNLVAVAAMTETLAYDEVCEAIDKINANMPLLAGRRLSLYVDRDYKPPRIVLTDWSQTTPIVVHGDE